MNRSSISSSEPSPVRQRRYFWVVVLCAATIFCAFILASEYLLRRIVEPNDVLPRQISLFFDARHREVSSAILGDSLPAMGFLSSDLAFPNLAVPGEGIHTTSVKLRVLFEERRIDRLVLAANPTTYAGRIIPGGPLEETYLRGAMPAIRLALPQHRSLLLQYWSTFLATGHLRGSTEVLAAGGLIQRNEADELKFANATEEVRRADALENIRRDTRHASAEVIAAGRKLYEQMLEYAAGHGARVCLVTYPHSPQYRELAKQMAFFSAMSIHWRTLADEFPGVRYVDLFSAISAEDQFSNSNHLNRYGGQRLAQLALERCFR